VALVSVAPWALGALGVDLGTRAPSPEALAALARDADSPGLVRALAGTYVHTLLEWTATCAAGFTAFLAFTHFRLHRDVVTPTIGMALLAAGLVDAFHTLAADGLVDPAADARDFVPFTWAVSRTFNAVVPLAALSMLLFARRHETGSRPRRSLRIVAAASVVLAGLAIGVTVTCARSADLPATTFPAAVVTRPWDALPLIVFALSGLVVYPLFRRRIRSHFALALWLSVIPDVATQLHMAFGSEALFDHHFNAAHLLKIVAYLVPCAGLVVDYVDTHRRATAGEREARAKAEQLERANEELRQIAYIASHDLQEPARMVVAYSELLQEEAEDDVGDETARALRYVRDGAARMQALVEALLEYTRVGAKPLEPVSVDADEALDAALANLDLRIRERDAQVERGPLPRVRSDVTFLTGVFQNLVGNALKFSPGPAPRVAIDAERRGDDWVFSVRDWGVGIEPRHQAEVFELFRRLHHRDAYEGTGLGLAIVNKTVSRLGGSVGVESTVGAGSTFWFTLPAEPDRP